MTRIALLLAGCAALSLAACDHPDAKRQHEARKLKVVSKLDCPERQGGLRRIAAASDGLSCTYEGRDAEVVLTVVNLNGKTPAEALAPIEDELKGLMPHLKVTPDDADDAEPKADGEEDRVDIHLPGVTIQADNGGAKIRAPGVEINAAEDSGAEIRSTRNLEAVAGDRDAERDGMTARYILARDSKDESGDWSVVSYEARGPVGGPMVVAKIKAKDRHGDGDDLFEDASDLVRHNVGGRKGHYSIKVD